MDVPVQGVVHYATTAERSSAHVTLGLKRQGHTWHDFAMRYCAEAVEDRAACSHLNAYLDDVSRVPTGLNWRRLAGQPSAAVPSTSQVCSSFKQVATKAHPDAKLSVDGMHSFEKAEVAQIMYPASRSNTAQLIARLLECKNDEKVLPALLAPGPERSRRGNAWSPRCGSCSCGSCDCDSYEP